MRTPGQSHGLEPLWEGGLSALIPLAPPLSSFSPAELGDSGCCGCWVSSVLPAAPGLPYKALMVPPKPRFQVTPDSPPQEKWTWGVGAPCHPATPCHRAVNWLFIQDVGEKEGLKQGGDTQETDSGFLNSSFYCIPWVTVFKVFYWTTSCGEGGGGEGRKRE